MRFRAYACHCTDCQTRSGSAFGIQQSVLSADMTIDGPLITGRHVQPSGAVAGIVACEKCLTRIYTSNDQRPGIVNLRAGTLDNSRDVIPAAHLWVSSKLHWVIVPVDAMCFETQPQDMAGWLEIFKPEAVAEND
ncbi:MAG: GFA family protein [Proteobacteria bacterium]|nr:GFA family protein [Pseudomonadota bacterium]